MSSDQIVGPHRKDAMKRVRRRYDAQFLVQHDEWLANGGDDAIEIGAGDLNLAFGRLDLGNAGKRDNQSFDLATFTPIRQNPSHEPAVVVGLDLTPHRRVTYHHVSCILQEIVVDEPACQVGKRPTDIGGDDIEQRLVAGVKKRMFSSASRKSVVTSVLFKIFWR